MGRDAAGRAVSPGRRRAAGGLVSRLGAWAADYAYAGWQQARHVLAPPALPTGPGGGAPVVLLPGIYETWEFLLPVARPLAAAGHPLVTVPELRFNDRPVPEAADRVVAALERADLRGAVLVAHSKGGLIGKRVMLSPAGARVAGMVAVATPFSGSRYARFMLGRALRAFDPRDPVLRALADELAVNQRIAAVYPRFDPHIPETGHLTGATNVELPLSGHFRPLGDPVLVERVVREVERLAADAPRS